MANKGLINRLINLREQNDYSQSLVAKKIGVDNSVISKIESGKRDVKTDELTSFSKLYKVSTDYLLSGTSKSHEDLTDKTYDSDLSEFLERNQGSMSYGGEDLSEEDLEKLDVALRIVFDKYRNKK